MDHMVGEYLLSVEVRKSIVIGTATYKLVKAYISNSCPDLKIPYDTTRYMAISPLIKDDKYLIPSKNGWLTEFTPKPRYRLRGTYRLRISWASSEAWKHSRAIVRCLTEVGEPEFRVEGSRVERITGGYLGQFTVKYLTPAQYKFRGIDGRSYILSIPSVSRILKPALDSLGFGGPEFYKDVDYYTGVVGSRLEKTTVYLDPLKPTNWALTGELTIALSSETPKTLANRIAMAVKALNYTGSGKSRLEGLGQVKVLIEK